MTLHFGPRAASGPQDAFALWVFHEIRGALGKRNTKYVKPEEWAAATRVSVSENLQCVYCDVGGHL
jgi:hypothetical protein